MSDVILVTFLFIVPASWLIAWMCR